ncbi:MAG TPA: subclass B1 metallo-beta-lactamase [Daejeonella sp.]|uniref:subclass B1 metallo-beta-lactamase n=1 Tax=Daejeonella sp. TaxID=2805397 RepID=UPI002EDABE9D
MIKHRLIFITALLIFFCHISVIQQSNAKEKTSRSADSTVTYKTESLIIQKLSNHIYMHISFLKTIDFGNVACNGMIVVNKNEAIIFDTPSDNKGAEELINYVTKTLNCKIKAIIPTHFHNDCVGGLEKFNGYNIPAYASAKTIELLNQHGTKFSKPINSFDDKFNIKIGQKKVYAAYFGEGHTRDNIIGYFPDDNAIFGGCLIKETGASKGFLGDANINTWSETVRKIKHKYPKARIVIPGHGKWGGTELFDYTIKLFDKI